MSDSEEPKVCQICSDFEPQAWRKSLCRNCFHTLEEHSEDLLAAQAETVSKEKSRAVADSPDKEGTKKADSSKDEKSKTPKTTGPAPETKDKKAGVPTPPSKNSPSKLSSSSSPSSSPSSPSRTSLKPSSSTSSSSPSRTSSSSSSTSPTTSSTTTTTTSSSSSSSLSSSKTSKTPSSPSSSPSQVPPFSKAKTLTSKFENTASKDTKSKSEPDAPATKPPAPKTLTKPDKSKTKFGDTKSTSSQPPSNTTDDKKSLKSDATKTNRLEDLKKPLSKLSSSVKDTKEDSGKKETSVKTIGKDDETKLKSSHAVGGPKGEEKDTKTLPGLKSKTPAPFGKGMLRSTKDKEKDTLEKRAEKILAAKEASSIEVKSKLASLGGKSSKFHSQEKGEKLEEKTGTDKSRENASLNTCVSGSGIGVKVGQAEKAGAQQRVDEKVHGQQNATKNAREIDKPGTGKVNTEVAGQDTRKSSWQVGGKDGGTGSTDVKKREDRTKDEDDRTKDDSRDNKRVPTVKDQGKEERSERGETAVHASDADKDRTTLHQDSKKDAAKVKVGHDAKLDGIHRPTLSSATSTSVAVTTAANKSGITTSTTAATTAPSSLSATRSSSDGVTTTSSAAGVEKTSPSTSQSLSKYLPSLQTHRKSEDGSGENNLPNGKTSTKDSTSGAASISDVSEVERLSKELKLEKEKVASLDKKLSDMEKKMKAMEDGKETANKSEDKTAKAEMEKSLKDLRGQLSEMQGQCFKLVDDNKSLMTKLQDQEKSVKVCQDVSGKTAENEILERDLELTEKELDEVKDENSELQREIMEMKNEMDEMYDTFRENEQDEFRELQKELDMTAKNCRILQFKLRKAERRNEQIEEDRMHYEDKLRHLQDQFDSQDAKNHIRVLEEELRIAKEVSVRLHDELDIVEDKKLKAQEDNKHLTELLEHTDKRQFRMEMEIDKLRDLVSDLRQQAKEAKSGGGMGSNHSNHSTNNRDSTTPEKTTPGLVIERQSSKESQEYDASQLMRDLCDTMERENDLKDQLKFTEEEAKTLRRRVSDMDEENENLRLQLQRMSEKASKHKKKEKEIARELDEERKISEAARTVLTDHELQQQASSAFTIMLGRELDDVIPGDEPIPVSERKDSTDEDLMNVMQLRIQLEMLEQELMNSHKKMDEMDLENENLMEEVKFLQERLGEYEKNQDSNPRPDPSMTDSYYEDRIKDLSHENDVLRWKLIEKDREVERMNLVQNRHSRDQPHGKRSDKLKKSKSLDTDHDPVVNDLRKQLEHAQMELIRARQRADEAEEKHEELMQQKQEPPKDTPTPPPSLAVPGVLADDAAVENVELKDKMKRMETELRAKTDTIKALAGDLQKLSRDPGKFHSVATSPMFSAGNQNIPGILSTSPGSPTAPASPQTTNQNDQPASRDRKVPSTLLLRDEPQRKKMALSPHLSEQSGEADGASNIHVHFAADPVLALSSDSTASADSTKASTRDSAGKAGGESRDEEKLSDIEKQTDFGGKPIHSLSSTESVPLSPSRNANNEGKSRRFDEPTRNASALSKTDDKSDNINKETNESISHQQRTLYDADGTTYLASVLSTTLEEVEVLTTDSQHPPSIEQTESLEKPSSKTECGVDEGVLTATMASKAHSEKDSSGKSKKHSGHKGDEPSKKKSEDGSSSESKAPSVSEEYKSILIKYPGGKSQVVTTGEESRVEMMEKVLDMDDEISELLSLIRRREDDYNRMCREVKSLRSQMEELRDDTRRNELDLMQELDMMHDKNTVMSNLLDIINERAEAAEEELEKRIQDGHNPSMPRSASNVSQVSALSDTSMGSDEVFHNAHGNREGVVNRDWEAKLKGRIESLERLLAEERQKVMMAEKKLALTATETVSPSVTDDVKLRLREKEMLQEELIESQRHLHIASDQIQGLKERFQILDEEHHRLKEDYGKLYNEMEKPMDEFNGEGKGRSPSYDAKTPVNALEDDDPFVSKRISVIEAPNFKELKKESESTEMKELKAQLTEYKQKAQDLEDKIEEINDIWRSKSSASDRDRDELEIQLNERIQEITHINNTINTLRKEMGAKDKIIAQYKLELQEKSTDLTRRSELVNEKENESKQQQNAKQLLETQISQKDVTLRGLDEKIRMRDERLKEKDDILVKIRSSYDEAKVHVKNYESKIRDLTVQVNDKDAVIALLRDQITSNSQPETAKGVTCPEAELTQLREDVTLAKEELEKAEKEKLDLQEKLEHSRTALTDSMVLWRNEKSTLQRDLNVMEEKIRLYEVYNTCDLGEAFDSLKEESHNYFKQKETLTCELESLKIDLEAAERTHRIHLARLQTDLNDKLKQLKSEVENNTKLRLESERLGVQAEKAYILQQEARVLRGEQQALKVRYESRLDKMANECNRMVTSIEKLQRQHLADQEVMQGFQQNLALVTERYTDQLLKAEDDQSTLGRQMNEIEELRSHLEGVMKIARELREESLDQERLRTELVNKMATDKARWEMDRVNLVSQVNQMDEQLSSASRQSNRTRDIQVNLGISWEKERKEQKRLLAEAHTLALDLQDQLRSRDETFGHERKEFLRQMEGDRMNWTKEKREMERKIVELDSTNRKLGTLQKRVKDMHDFIQEKTDQWRAEQKDLIAQLSESRQAHSKDCKKVEEVLAGLIKLKELGLALTSQEQMAGHSDDSDKNIIAKTVKDSLQEITRATEELSRYTPRTELSDDSSSKSDPYLPQSDVIIVPELSVQVQHEAAASPSSKTTAATSASSKPAHSKPTISVAHDHKQTQPATTPSFTTPKTTAIKTPSKVSDKIKTLSIKLEDAVKPKTSDTAAKTASSSSKPTTPQSTAVTMRPFDSTSRWYDRPPSYTSGTRSAQSSRSTTPEVDSAVSKRNDRGNHGLFYQPHTLPKHNQQQSVKSTTTIATTTTTATTTSSSLLSTSSSTQKPKRPGKFIKSLSTEGNISSYLDSNSPHRLYSSSSQKSSSTSNTPTHAAPPNALSSHVPPPSFSSIPSSLDSNLLSPDCNASNSSSGSLNKKCSPRTARKRFFDETPSPSQTNEFLSWPERKRTTQCVQKSLPDASEFRKEAEVEHDLISGRHQHATPSLKVSNSWNENMHFQDVGSEEQFSQEESTSGVECSTPEDTIISSRETTMECSSIPENQSISTSTLPRSGKSAKEKRKFFKKAGSLDSSVGSSIAKVGVSAMPMAAPSGFTPSNFFATVKGKLLKPVLRNKSSDNKGREQEMRSPSPLFIPTEVPDINIGSSGSTLLPVPVPQRTFDETENDEDKNILPELASGRSRLFHRQKKEFKDKGRSKSMDERKRPDSGSHTSSDVWRFNETHL